MRWLATCTRNDCGQSLQRIDGVFREQSRLTLASVGFLEAPDIANGQEIRVRRVLSHTGYDPYAILILFANRLARKLGRNGLFSVSRNTFAISLVIN